MNRQHLRGFTMHSCHRTPILVLSPTAHARRQGHESLGWKDGLATIADRENRPVRFARGKSLYTAGEDEVVTPRSVALGLLLLQTPYQDLGERVYSAGAAVAHAWAVCEVTGCRKVSPRVCKILKYSTQEHRDSHFLASLLCTCIWLQTAESSPGYSDSILQHLLCAAVPLVLDLRVVSG